MTYNNQEERDRFESVLDQLPTFKSPGELNYFITKVLLEYENQKEGTSYQIYNDIIGALECIKQEFYRKIIVDFENYKCDFNGEVYED